MEKEQQLTKYLQANGALFMDTQVAGSFVSA